MQACSTSPFCQKKHFCHVSLASTQKDPGPCMSLLVHASTTHVNSPFRFCLPRNMLRSRLQVRYVRCSSANAQSAATRCTPNLRPFSGIRGSAFARISTTKGSSSCDSLLTWKLMLAVYECLRILMAQITCCVIFVLITSFCPSTNGHDLRMFVCASCVSP